MNLKQIIASLLYLDILLIHIVSSKATSMELSITEISAEPQSISLELDLDSDVQKSNTDSTVNRTVKPDGAEQSRSRRNCPKGFIRFKQSCYHVVQANGEMTWDIANTYCQLHNSRLVDIQTEAEQLFIENLVRNKQENAVYWIGATNNKGRGLWEWTAISQPLSYTLWVSQWSSWAYEVNKGSCAILDTSESSQWMFWPCQNNFYMAGKKHDQKTGIGIICEQTSAKNLRKVRHHKHKRRRRRKRKGRRNRRHKKIIGQSFL